MKRKFEKVKNVISGAVGAGMLSVMSAVPVLADDSGVGTVDSGMKVIKTVAIGIVSTIGVVVLVKGIMNLGSAISQRDSTGMAQAGAECAGGLLMAGAGIAIGLLGF